MSTVRSVTNTTEQTRKDPLVFLAEAMGPGGTGDAVASQEAQGQREVLFSDTLPSEMGDQAAFEALGFTFGDPVEGDEMFRAATLPEGWKRAGSSHSMWSYIEDEDGYRRVSIFYKAAFYDRSARMSIDREPKTAAQSDAYDAIHKEIYGDGHRGYVEPFWTTGDSRREGPNYVYQWTGCKGETQALADGDTFPHGGANAWADDGRRVEFVVAPDGSLVERREFTETLA